MANLFTDNLFTQKADFAYFQGQNWDVLAGQSVKTLGGDDIIKAEITTNNSGIYNDGTIDTGRGGDTLTGIAPIGIGIANLSSGVIQTGSGDDVIRGQGRIGILNNGLISTGAGNDTVDALTGGFAGAGTIDLGANDDTLKGFGSGTFIGGRGIDTLVFGEGRYSFSNGSITREGSAEIMIVTGFERIRGESDTTLVGLPFNGSTVSYEVNSSGFLL